MILRFPKVDAQNPMGQAAQLCSYLRQLVSDLQAELDRTNLMLEECREEIRKLKRRIGDG